ncbi:MAG: ABC transporter ATP-binding protein [Desulfurella sp.]|uniref:Phospholipid/cholesterol/gamma-HCH transport system ATP-binding protein n=1 Tax=Desulfurella multipotens TaxID=79269 RepID=A0A1G6KKS3_9BACT|nr:MULTISPECIES: ATP-binding cassette domain-containing protein [Desulfurella]AHF96730.1 organic solvent ABC transporter ATP-binding protein [Desulfurella acetivorans A63]HEX13430.1 ATP-binding cassette domain-containing protein [Desulfurella acetivorans]PMP63195.1 MAG: ABC transporter ATP-binding protein [Desulfurella multipotens]PMP88034.1 MAG: ABC transporter ATP-binding protein [Desulfurella sp.]SDC31702.1 phospholipid/cholesterol/gamma-HCH transport system ATP-binding protein [Desulfurell
MIEIKNLRKAFGNQVVLNNLDLKIEAGKITVILGKSGQGKSVLIKSIIGTLKPDSGKIMFDNKNLLDMKLPEFNKIRMKFGVLFQEAALFDSMNVFENVAFPVVEHKLINKKNIKDEVRRVLDLVELGDVEEKYPSELSGGMKKRVGLARAIITKPQIIFFDEPTTGLDPIVSYSIAKLIKDMKAKLNTTCLVITHDLDVANLIADFIGFLDGGKIIEFDEKENFFRSNSPIVREFLDAFKGG